MPVPSLLLTLLACSTPRAERFADCEDPACREAWLVERWETEPGAVSEGLAEVEDPLERELLVLALAETFPGTVAPLCAQLAEGIGRRRCEAIDGRPHLRVELAPPPEPLREVLSSHPATSPWTVRAPEGLVRSQATAVAMAASTDAEAAAACQAHPEGRYRDECVFRSAEARASAELCQAAGAFAANCLGHVALRLSERAPAADRPDWEPLLHALQAQTAALPAPLAEAFADRVFAHALQRSYAAAGSLGGAPLDALPPAAWPHVRMALAWRLFEQGPPSSLEAGAKQLADTLQSRPAPRFSPPPQPFALASGVRALDASDADLPWVHVLANSGRPLADSDEDELALCVLYALVQAGHAVPEGATPEGGPALRWALDHLPREEAGRAP